MTSKKFALLGAPPVFSQAVPVGQLYFPSWDRYEAAMRGIFNRRYYTNQGPLAQELEAKLQEYLGVKHAICVTNATIGLMMAAEALELRGKVIVPSFTFIASAQSLKWCDIKPVFCDVDPHTHQLAIEQLDSLIDEQVSGIMGVNLWGGSCKPIELESYARSRNLELYFDSAHAFGCVVNDKRIANFGALEVFSFHATKILSATEGGCITTNDDGLAARLRNIRSSYGAGKPMSVVKTSNGRMSEAQAAIALMSLEDFPENQSNNQALYHLYKKCLERIPGIRLVEPANVSFSNYQYVVCEIDETKYGLSRDSLIALLKAENVIARRYFYPGTHRSIDFKEDTAHSNNLPVTEQLCDTCIQLPIGANIDFDDVEKICGIIERAHSHVDLLKSHFKGSGR